MHVPKRVHWWSRENLRRHFDQHPAGRDQVCWSNILHLPSPVSEEQYERTSYQVWETGGLQVVCINRRPDRFGQPQNDVRVSRVDERGVRVVVALEDGAVITCFHIHDPWWRHRDHELELPEQVLQMFQKRLVQDRAAKLESDHQPPIWKLTW